MVITASGNIAQDAPSAKTMDTGLITAMKR
jgi:hypothetical protein